jgi:hypothetical protein
MEWSRRSDRFVGGLLAWGFLAGAVALAFVTGTGEVLAPALAVVNEPVAAAPEPEPDQRGPASVEFITNCTRTIVRF